MFGDLNLGTETHIFFVWPNAYDRKHLIGGQ